MARRSATDGDEAKSLDCNAKSEDLEQRIAEKLSRARHEGQGAIQILRHEGEEEGAAIIKQARGRMDEHLKGIRASLARQTKAAEMQLKQYSQ